MNYVLEYDGGVFTAQGDSFLPVQFTQTLTKFNGVKPWGLALWAVPDGIDYDTMLATGRRPEAYLQAGGSADTMTLQIRKPGTGARGAVSVLYVVGHPPNGDSPVDVPVRLATGTEIVSEAEVFTAAEATDLFVTYQGTGDIPPAYTLRPLMGWTADGTFIDYRESETNA